MRSSTNRLFMISFVLLFAGCQKQDVDPRDRYEGTYSIRYSITTSGSLGTKTVTGNMLLTVSKGGLALTPQNEDNTVMSIREGNGEAYTINLNQEKSTFEALKYSSLLTVAGGDKVLFITDTEGTFGPNKIQLTKTSYGNYSIVTAFYTGTRKL